MATMNVMSSKWSQRVVVLSLLLLFFTIPHTLEDFATGEPAEAGVPAPLLSLVGDLKSTSFDPRISAFIRHLADLPNIGSGYDFDYIGLY